MLRYLGKKCRSANFEKNVCFSKVQNDKRNFAKTNNLHFVEVNPGEGF
jgi:hypothetical protein